MTKLGVWVVLGTSVTHVVCRHQMRILNSSFAYLFRLAITRKANIQSSIWATVMKLGWYVTQVLPMCSVVVDAHIKYLICIFPQGGPRCIFYEYSERVSREPRNSSYTLLISFVPKGGVWGGCAPQ